MERIRAARKMPLPPAHDRSPMVYQSGSDGFLAPGADVAMADDGLGLDLEATIAVVTDDVRRGTPVAEAADHVRLVLLANDYTFRHLLPEEYAKSVGPYQAKPARPLAPFALTPDELGPAWDGARLRANVRCWVNDELLGDLDSAADCQFGFNEILAFLARTRALASGSIVGSGTISNRDPARGFGCLAEKFAVEAEPRMAPTPLLRNGDRVRIDCIDDDGRSLFGAIDNRIVVTA
jgi:fumarylacetoacetate (FAA) hydrolase